MRLDEKRRDPARESNVTVGQRTHRTVLLSSGAGRTILWTLLYNTLLPFNHWLLGSDPCYCYTAVLLLRGKRESLSISFSPDDVWMQRDLNGIM
jgi:hypothetical protein